MAEEDVASWIEIGKYPVVGMHGIQGAGKSTLAAKIVHVLHSKGIRAVTISIDDFYFPRAQMGMASISGHPGSHDIQLLCQCIQRLLTTHGDVAIPTYDKTAFQGRGDRGEWKIVKGGVKHVILEGWCLAFRPVACPPRHMKAVNDALKIYDVMRRRLDALILFDAPAHMAYEWRETAEAVLRSQGIPAMSKSELKRFVDYYMPVYNLYGCTVGVDHLPTMVLKWSNGRWRVTRQNMMI